MMNHIEIEKALKDGVPVDFSPLLKQGAFNFLVKKLDWNMIFSIRC